MKRIATRRIALEAACVQQLAYSQDGPRPFIDLVPVETDHDMPTRSEPYLAGVQSARPNQAERVARLEQAAAACGAFRRARYRDQVLATKPVL